MIPSEKELITFIKIRDFVNYSTIAKFYEIIEQLLESKTLNKTQTNGIKSFTDTFENLKSNEKPSIILESIIKRTNYYQYLKDSFLNFFQHSGY